MCGRSLQREVSRLLHNCNGTSVSTVSWGLTRDSSACAPTVLSMSSVVCPSAVTVALEVVSMVVCKLVSLCMFFWASVSLGATVGQVCF